MPVYRICDGTASEGSHCGKRRSLPFWGLDTTARRSERDTTDRGRYFWDSVVQHSFKLLTIEHLLTTSYHAQCDGMAERANRSIIFIIRNFSSYQQNDWDLLVALACWALNTVPNENTGLASINLVYGRMPRHPLDLIMNFKGFDAENNNTSEYAKNDQN